MKFLSLLSTLLFISVISFAQTDTTKVDTTKKEIIIKDNWSKKKGDLKKSKKKKDVIIKKSTRPYKRNEHTTNIGVGNKSLKIKELEDTTIISIGNKELIISETRGNSKVRLRTKRRSRGRFRGHWTGIEFGVNAFANEDYSMYNGDKFMDLDLNKSIAVNINFLQYNINLSKNKKNFGIVTGMGLSWYNFRFDREISIRENDETGLVEGFDLPEEWNVKKSKLTMSYLTVPVLLEYQIPIDRHNLFISTGVIGGLKLGSHTKIKYKNDGTHKKKNRDDFNIRPYKLDASVKIGFRGIHLWGTYGLYELFEKNKGPELTPYALGISLHFD